MRKALLFHESAEIVDGTFDLRLRLLAFAALHLADAKMDLLNQIRLNELNDAGIGGWFNLHELPDARGGKALPAVTVQVNGFAGGLSEADGSGKKGNRGERGEGSKRTGSRLLKDFERRARSARAAESVDRPGG